MAGFSIIYGADTKTPASLPLAASQTIYAGDLVTWNGSAVEAIGGGTTAFCGVAAETPVAGASTILVYSDPAAQFLIACSSAPAAVNVGKDYAPTATAGAQVLNLSATGWLRVVQVVGALAAVRVVDHQFSGNEGDAQRVPEPSTAGTWLRKVLAGVGSWVAGIPALTTVVTGDLVKQKSDGTLEGAGVAPTALALKDTAGDSTKVATINSAGNAVASSTTIASLTAKADKVVPDNPDELALLTATTGALKKSGLVLGGVARRPAACTTGHIAVFDANKDPVDGGAVPDVSVKADKDAVGDSTKVATINSAGNPVASATTIASLIAKADKDAVGDSTKVATINASGNPVASVTTIASLTAKQDVLGAGTADILVANAGTGAMERSGTTLAGKQSLLGAGALDVAQVNATTGALERSGTTVAALTAAIKGSAPIDNTLNAVDFTVSASGCVYRADVSANSRVCNLPTAASAGVGKRYDILIKGDMPPTRTLTIDPNGTETINGAGTLAVNGGPGKFIRVSVYCDGSAWYADEI